MAEEPNKRKKAKSKKPKGRQSTTGSGKGVKSDQTNWLNKLQASRIKFDDDQKDVYLAALTKHGMKTRAAQEAGVSPNCVIKHIKNDTNFKESVDDAIATYRDSWVEYSMDIARNGWVSQVYIKDGEVTGEKRELPIRLIELELKRVEPEYREKQSLELSGNVGGVLVAPAGQTPDNWIEQQKEENKDKQEPGEDDAKT